MRERSPEDETQQHLEFVLAQLDALAAAEVEPQEQARFLPFLRHYYEIASLDGLRARTPEDLFQVARQHFELARERAQGQLKVVVRPPLEPGAAGSRGFATLDSVVDDMPFLVDTVTMAIHDAGSAIDWSDHPLMRVRRDAQGTLQQAMALGADESTAQRESLIHIEFEALADEADYAELQHTVERLLADLRVVIDDFPAIRSQLSEVVSQLDQVPHGADPEEYSEAQAFLRWLDDGRFTFLGYVRSLAEVDESGAVSLRTVPENGLGLSRQNGRFADVEKFIAPQDELNRHIQHSGRLIVVTKANTRSPIHHPQVMDSISVKQFAADGTVQGTHRFVGLFSTEAYYSRPRYIPLIRRKAAYVMQRAGVPEDSHSGKHLRDILHQLPRDELLQSSEDELFDICMGIRALHDRLQLKLFMRRDRYGRFYSCLVYLPRDRYSREIRERIGTELMEICNGLSLERNVDFMRGGLARIHYTVHTPPGTRIPLSAEDVQTRLLKATRSWRDELRDVLMRVPSDAVRHSAERFADAFPLYYTELTTPLEAAADIQYLSQLSEQAPVLPRLMIDTGGGAAQAVGLKLYSWARPIELSDVLPTLENFGLRVIRQEPTEIDPRGGTPCWIQEFDIRVLAPSELSAEQQKSAFESAFSKCWSGETENDGLNRLVLFAGLEWRQVVCVRTLLKYLIQTGLPYSQDYMERLLSDHAPITRQLVRLFETRFDPQMAAGAREAEVAAIDEDLQQRLDQVATLDGDRVLRAFLATIKAVLRTNYYQPRADGGSKSYISIKLDPSRVPELPQPLPMFEIFVYAPEVEGIHLRGGKVARGGLRWSDRRQDFRTEVLGLMKAQMVKNAVIVPVGAKGGFVVKRGDASNREAWLKAGVECYKTFIRGLLDITDNRVADDIVPPPDVLRYDEDDPYLVVAADKGTATFSDTANGISAEYGFWMGDAFASGGSAGYDHKKMGITARGAWESVKRHFRELGKDIQNEEFTVVGVGDMSGDVFGNGMLLSRHIRLIAAFDHRHIFIDPNPDAATSYAERERMFALPRSSWDDYDRTLLSEGGGIWPRSAKQIKVSTQVQEALGLSQDSYAPNELLRAILKAPVDLLWNGGIGTYVKSRYQSNAEVGDRANDMIRVNGAELRCKVVGEGGNLGLTQLGRVEYALAGGRINTDAIDNSGGVHSSDREVNIKIPLNRLMNETGFSVEERNPLLVSMTEDVARAVLADSYVQSLALSLLEHEAASRLDEHANLIRTLEKDGLLARAVEYLPDDEGLKERRARNLGLSRPELAVLLSYAKISLFGALDASEVPDDPFFTRDLLAYFAPVLVQRYGERLQRHRLKREIIATILSNAIVNRMGFAYAHRFADDQGVSRAEVVKAYAMAHEVFDGDSYWLPIQALDNQIDAQLQLRLYSRASGLMKHATNWLVNHRWPSKPIAEAVDFFEQPIKEIAGLLPECLPGSYREEWQRAQAAMIAEGVPEDVATTLANTLALGSAPDIVELAAVAGVPVAQATAAYFLVGERLRVLWLLGAVNGLVVRGRWQALARTTLRDDIYRLHRSVVADVLAQSGGSPQARFESWLKTNEARVQFCEQRMVALQASGTQDFMTLAVGVRELRKLHTA